MAIRLLKKLTERIRGNSDDKANAVSVGKTSSPAKSSNGSRRGKRSSASSDKSVSAKKAETWRPGQKSGGSSSAKGSPRKTSSGRNNNRRPPAARQRPPKKKKDDSSVLTQPGENVEKNVAGSGRSGGRSASDSQPGKNVEKKAAVNQKEWTLDDFKIEPEEGKTRFHDVDIPLDIMHAISDMGFRYCTPIQAGVLKEDAEGNNVAGRAQTGTGKTAAFLLLTFKQFWNNPPQGKRTLGRPRALVLAPTRELVIQIVKDAEAIGKYTPIRSLAIYGGTGYEEQERQLQKSPVDLIAATPGRLIDFYNKRKIDLSGVEVLVIDEADRMLDMGFIPDVRRIIRSTPPKDKRRTLLFSATLTDDVMRLASQWMPDPKMVEIEPDQVAVDTVKQLVYMVKSHEKFTVLYNLLKRPNIGRVLIFANRRDQTERIAGELQRYGVPCEILSGAVNQNRRMRVLEDFRSGKILTVVATDVAGRGLHVDDINHVVNFDLPYEAEDYVHRIGRTGRAGSAGTAVSFACEDESFTIPDIEKYIGEDLACKYPEEILLKELPHTNAKPYQKSRPPQRNHSNRSGGYRGSRSRPSGRR